MKLFLLRKNQSVNAIAEWNQNTNTFKVLKGSVVSESIATHTKFRSAKTIEKTRANGTVVNRILMTDVLFKSASSAANFVTGSSTNGLEAWKDITGKKLKNILAENNNEQVK